MNVERRLFFFRFGDPRARMNWVHVENLILAHRLAAEALTRQRDHVSVSAASLLWTVFKQIQPRDLSSMSVTSPVFVLSVVFQSGQVYFINDGVSVNLFEWLSPLVRFH